MIHDRLVISPCRKSLKRRTILSATKNKTKTVLFPWGHDASVKWAMRFFVTRMFFFWLRDGDIGVLPTMTLAIQFDIGTPFLDILCILSGYFERDKYDWWDYLAKRTWMAAKAIFRLMSLIVLGSELVKERGAVNLKEMIHFALRLVFSHLRIHNH